MEETIADARIVLERSGLAVMASKIRNVPVKQRDWNLLQRTTWNVDPKGVHPTPSPEELWSAEDWTPPEEH